jgi:hypothetical protein
MERGWGGSRSLFRCLAGRWCCLRVDAPESALCDLVRKRQGRRMETLIVVLGMPGA